LLNVVHPEGGALTKATTVQWKGYFSLREIYIFPQFKGAQAILVLYFARGERPDKREGRIWIVVPGGEIFL
jgi:hypothetical protein